MSSTPSVHAACCACSGPLLAHSAIVWSTSGVVWNRRSCGPEGCVPIARCRRALSRRAVPLISFEWHQRPENVLAGHLTWADFRPPAHPSRRGRETAALGFISTTGTPSRSSPSRYCVSSGKGGPSLVPAKPFLLRTAHRRSRRRALAACRHGGLTELGDAGLTEQEGMAQSGHARPDALRIYQKRTEVQRAQAARVDRSCESHRRHQYSSRAIRQLQFAESEQMSTC